MPGTFKPEHAPFCPAGCLPRFHMELFSPASFQGGGHLQCGHWGVGWSGHCELPKCKGDQLSERDREALQNSDNLENSGV